MCSRIDLMLPVWELGSRSHSVCCAASRYLSHRGGVSGRYTAPLYLRTLWRYTNAVIIIIIYYWNSCQGQRLNLSVAWPLSIEAFGYSHTALINYTLIQLAEETNYDLFWSRTYNQNYVLQRFFTDVNSYQHSILPRRYNFSLSTHLTTATV